LIILVVYLRNQLIQQRINEKYETWGVVFLIFKGLNRLEVNVNEVRKAVRKKLENIEKIMVCV